ncbi:MAG TPA: hypothetical protein VKE69_09325, partial [Planctomycetota bacterium]|nr:hypothetical protein [Planctomycetota bacterium]
DDGSGPALYVGGAFTSVAGIPTHVAKWSGSAWSALPGLSDYVNALAVFDGGSGPRLYAGTNEGLAWWNGSSWVSIFSDGPVFSLLTFDDGSGPALFVGGYGIGKFDGQWWYPLGSGVDGVIDPFDFYLPSVSAMTAFDDGSGPALYVGGYFMTAGGVATRCIAKWNGVSWSGLAGGLDVPSDGLPWVYALRAFDDGSGPALYVGGSIAGAGGVSAYGLMRWKGSTWSAMPAGGLDTNAMAFAAFDDGSGPALFVGGLFATAGGAPAHSMAKWNGTSWSALGSGMSGGTLYPGHAWVFTLSVFDDGSGPALYAGGDFTTSPAGDANLAKWAGCPPSALPGLVAYGTGTPGCQGTQTCGGNSSPHVGNSAFQITCDKTPPSSVGLGLVASAPDVAGHDLFGVGVAIHLDLALSPQVFTLDFLSDAAGHGAAAAPLPNNPGIVGAKLDAQAIWYWAGACSLPSAYSLSSSKGLEITFLP